MYVDDCAFWREKSDDWMHLYIEQKKETDKYKDLYLHLIEKNIENKTDHDNSNNQQRSDKSRKNQG